MGNGIFHVSCGKPWQSKKQETTEIHQYNGDIKGIPRGNITMENHNAING